MSENSTNIQPPEINPFQTPALETADPEPQPRVEFVPPSLRLLGSCILMVLATSSLAAIQTRDPLTSLAGPRAMAIIVTVLVICSVAIGLGIALLIETWRRRQFASLMPGHWRLIAYSFTFGGEIGYALVISSLLNLEDSTSSMIDSQWMGFVISSGVVSVLPVALYLRVILKSQETGWWRNYALWNLLYYAVFVPQAIGIATVWVLGRQDLIWTTFLVSAVTANAIGVVASVPFLLGVAADSREKIRRDRYHDVGLVLPPFAQFAVWIVYQF